MEIYFKGSTWIKEDQGPELWTINSTWTILLTDMSISYNPSPDDEENLRMCVYCTYICCRYYLLNLQKKNHRQVGNILANTANLRLKIYPSTYPHLYIYFIYYYLSIIYLGGPRFGFLGPTRKFLDPQNFSVWNPENFLGPQIFYPLSMVYPYISSSEINYFCVFI